MPVKVAFMQLSSCWGCHQSLVNLHLDLLLVLPELEIVYWPAVVDFKLKSLEDREDGSVLVGFIEGHVRTEQDRNNILLMRKKCAILVALGACANHGSVAGLANLWDREELLNRKFKEVPSIGASDIEGNTPTETITPITDKVYTVPQITNVEVKVPGCPPTSENIFAAVAYLLTLAAPSQADASKCVYDGIPEGEAPIEKGQLCFGSISAPPKAGLSSLNGPWLGQYGPTSNPDMKRAQMLFDKIAAIDELDKDTAIDIKKFLMLYLNLPGFDFMYFVGDPVQRLAEHPETFVEGKVGDKTILTLKQTGNEMIDNILGLCLFKLRNSKEFKFSQGTVCSTCAREISDKTFTEIKRDYEGIANQEICFLEQGYFCAGPATKAGCGTLCPNKANAPCLGCYGPPENIPDQGAKMLSTYASLAQVTPEELTAKNLDPAGLFNRFSLAASTLGGKVIDKKEGA
jgi:F420-non-reducing hydrogenase small subunit